MERKDRREREGGGKGKMGGKGKGEGKGRRGRVLKLNLCTKRPADKLIGCNPDM